MEVLNTDPLLPANTIAKRFTPPSDYQREPLDSNSFGFYLRHLPLLPEGAHVHLFNGLLKADQTVHAAVVDMDVGKRDLQQCADAVMRLRAEYLWQHQRYEDIKFNFTNGWQFEYQPWRNGSTLEINGNRTGWKAGTQRKTSYKEFRKYLNLVFSYAGTLSLEKELTYRPLSAIEIGDVFIKGGSPGHAVIVVDVAIHPENGDKAFLLAQSYMPAQQIHILNNLYQSDISPWYRVSDVKGKLETPEWTFDVGQLKSF